MTVIVNFHVYSFALNSIVCELRAYMAKSSSLEAFSFLNNTSHSKKKVRCTYRTHVWHKLLLK